MNSWKAVALVCLLAASASGQELDVSDVTTTRGQGWSAHAAETAGTGATLFYGQVGWPSLSAGLWHGMSEALDVGGKVGFLYGFEGVLIAGAPGLGLQGQARYQLVDGERMDLAITTAPGLLIHFYPTFTQPTLILPVGLVVGIPVGSALMLNLGADVRLLASFGAFARVTLPLLVGAGAEYFVDQSFALTFNTRMGPALSTHPLYPTAFAFEAFVGAAYRR